MELMLIRHGLPVRRELTEGIADPELSPEGIAQAEHLAAYLSSEQIDAIYSSPLTRAYETAQPIAAPRNLTIGLIDGVAEWDRNSSEYIPIEELKAAGDPRWQALANGEWTTEDETPEQFRNRVVASIEHVIDNHPGQRVAITCHGGVVNAYFGHILGMPVNGGFFYPNYTSIHRIAASTRGHRTLVTVNETSHLRGTGLPMGLVQQS
jgi:probable phosphoglycerate mutase